MRKAAYLFIVFLIGSACLYAQSTENDIYEQKNIQQPDNALGWKQVFFDELTQRLVGSHIPRSTLVLIFKEVDMKHLPKNPKAAAVKVFHWAEKYDTKLRKGCSHSQVALELKRELALASEENDANELLISVYIWDEYDKLKIKDKKDKDKYKNDSP
jgi:hypothetical protein